MNGPELTANAATDPAMIDRLVDGELEEAERASLLRSLDREPDGWKRCALAFLESQAWREAAGEGAMRPALPGPGGAARAPQPVLLRRLMAVAAMVAVAFCVGFVSRDAVSTRGGSRMATQIARQSTPSDGPASFPATQVARIDSPLPTPVPELLRLRMERQGYRVEGDRRVVPVALGDGHKLAVPVDTVSMKYVGQRVY